MPTISSKHMPTSQPYPSNICFHSNIIINSICNMSNLNARKTIHCWTIQNFVINSPICTPSNWIPTTTSTCSSLSFTLFPSFLVQKFPWLSGEVSYSRGATPELTSPTMTNLLVSARLKLVSVKLLPLPCLWLPNLHNTMLLCICFIKCLLTEQQTPWDDIWNSW